MRLKPQIQIRIAPKAECKRIALRSQQHRFQLQKRAQELIRMDNVALAVAFVSVNNPSPAIFRDRATISPRPTHGGASCVFLPGAPRHSRESDDGAANRIK